MILPEALLTLAKELANLDPRKPRQASLRRAVSTAYYAVFHYLVQQTARTLVGPSREMVEASTRWFSHGGMADACNLFTGPKVHGEMATTTSLERIPVGPQLQDVARAFRALQQARHEADYDMSSKRFTRQRTQQLIEQAEQVFTDWGNAAADPWRPMFMLFLLTGDDVAVTR